MMGDKPKGEDMGRSNSLGKSPSIGVLPGQESQIGEYMCNDGLMKLEITGTEVRGGWNAKHTVYHI